MIMIYNHPIFLPCAALLLILAYLAVRFQYVRAASYKLRHIPTIGSSGIISSCFESYRYFSEGQKIIQEGYNKYYGTPFKIPTMGRYVVIASGPEMIEDIRRAGPDELSFIEASRETTQGDYTLGKQTRLHPFHAVVIRTALTRNLGHRFPDIKDEITASFLELVPPSEEWKAIPTLDTMMSIVGRTTNRLFVGLPLCRNPEYIQLQEQAAFDVFRTAQVINKWPKIFRPIVGRIVTRLPSNLRRTISYVGPIIEDRLLKLKESDGYLGDESDDLISWLISEAPESERNVKGIALRLIIINFAAIHTTSTALTNVLYDLAVYPEYVKPMREEVEAVIAAEGWTKVSMGKMWKLDSFVKESQRLSTGGLNISRRALKDFTFSNGIKIPAGTDISIATYSTHVDGTLFPDPYKFEGFRYASKRKEEGEGLKHQMVALSNDFLSFGSGRFACPGRFFAVNVLKVLLIHVLMNYDVKMADNGPRPSSIWFQALNAPDPTAKVMFRKCTL